MTLEEITGHIALCAKTMNAFYGSVVFDEWAVVSVMENQARILSYNGPRQDGFLANFMKDLGSLRAELLGGNYGVGDFEFSRHAVGTGSDAFLVLGQGNYLICNHTGESMDSIAKKPSWLNAQVPFVELAEKLRASPLQVPWETKVFPKT